MNAVRRLATLVLLACWLPALLHCRLEAAGFLSDLECCQAGPGPTVPIADHGCVDDACDVVEGEFTTSSPVTLKAPGLCAGWGDLIPATPGASLPPLEKSGVAPATAAPPDLVHPLCLFAPAPLSPQAP
ncbi:MAG: hypothetical protein HZC55_04325 [Verrucomicrobia bacterium]|nr:hypothetical protein [Verrucomicrobiota bacterium]